MDFDYSLPTGTLTLSVHNNVNPDEFFTVAARDNPNRAFLFVSHYLGKHLPTSPAKMLAAQQQLVNRLPKMVDPVLFIGMAETATAFGRGIYDLWQEKNSPQKSLYLDTTRYQVDGYQRLEFAEEHSHAPAIGLHFPKEQALREIFFTARTLVLLDDELSTGNTFVNLVKTLQRVGLPLEKVIMVSLTDFSSAFEEKITAALAPLSVEKVSLLIGSWSYQASKPMAISEKWQTQTEKRPSLPVQYFTARTGASGRLSFSPEVLNQWLKLIEKKEKILVLGCGEFMYAPFLLAQIAEQSRVKTDFCATTRSPIKLWGVMKHRFEWLDPYGEGVRNFLYNYQIDNYDAVFLISELPTNDILQKMAQDLKATLFCLSQ